MSMQSAQQLLLGKREVAARVRLRLPTSLFEFGASERLELVFDIDMHLAFLGESLRLGVTGLFTEYAVWSAQLLRTAGGELADFAQCLDAIEAELRATGSGPWVDDAAATLQLAHERIRRDLPLTESHLREDNPHRGAAGAFLEACLHLRRSQALAIVHEVVRQGARVEEVYLDVITPVMRELGRMWHLNQITVGQEHYCTAVAQMVMAQLFPLVFDGDRPAAGRVVAVCVAGELHEIGARMVADLFEMNGWDTVFLGADVPRASIVDTLVETEADVLAISATLAANLGQVTDLIEAVRADPACAGVRVLVGGAAFDVDPAIWRRVGADGWAQDADHAMALAREWSA